MGVVDHGLAGRAEHEGGEAAPAPGSDDDQLGVGGLGVVDYRRSGITAQLDTADGMLVQEVVQLVPDELVFGLFHLLVVDQVHALHRVHGRRRLEDVHHVQFCVQLPCHLDGPFHHPVGGGRWVHGCNDRHPSAPCHQFGRGAPATQVSSAGLVSSTRYRRLASTPSTPSTRLANSSSNCDSVLACKVPSNRTRPSSTVTVTLSGSMARTWPIRRSRISHSMSTSGRVNTPRMSARLTIPISRPSSSTTGRRLTRLRRIRRAASAWLASGPIVTTSRVMTSPTVSASRRRSPRLNSNSTRLARLRVELRSTKSASLTTPTTFPSDTTGRPLTPWLAINWAASLREVLSLTETTSVVMRSRTFMSRHSSRRFQPFAVGRDMPGPFLPYPSGTSSKARS